MNEFVFVITFTIVGYFLIQTRKSYVSRRESAKVAIAAEKNTIRKMVAQILCELHKDLEKNHVAGFGPWLAACVDNQDRLTPELAIFALDKTRREVDSYFWWIFDDAEEKLYNLKKY